MRRTIDGKIYDTARAEFLASCATPKRRWTMLRSGRRHFLHVTNAAGRGGRIEPVTARDAIEWLATGLRKLGATLA